MQLLGRRELDFTTASLDVSFLFQKLGQDLDPGAVDKQLRGRLRIEANQRPIVDAEEGWKGALKLLERRVELFFLLQLEYRREQRAELLHQPKDVISLEHHSVNGKMAGPCAPSKEAYYR